VKSLEALLQAWQAQATKEVAEDEAAEKGDEAQAADTASQRSTGNERGSAGASSSPAPAQPAAAPSTPLKDSPIARQRALIADYMRRHEQLAAGHPMATPCGRCRHRLEGSPTKDESVPSCAWAGRLRSVEFKCWRPVGGEGPVIPVCRQFAPAESWAERIPAHAAPPGVPREWLKDSMLRLVKAAGHYAGGRQLFEFLTGRPMGGDEKYDGWFATRLDENIGSLSDGQLWTLFIWAMSEWQRDRDSRRFDLPLNGAGVQFATYHEVGWQMADD
jgi:hypothetical protein